CTLENREQLLTITSITLQEGQYCLALLLHCTVTYRPNLEDVQLVKRPKEPPPSLALVPFALVTVILLHIIVAVVYYTSRTKVLPEFTTALLMRWSGCTLENSKQQLQDKQPLRITAHTGGSILLPCFCPDLQTKPDELRWRRPKGGKWVEMSFNSDQYRNRVLLVNDHSPGNLSLLISHLTEGDGELPYRLLSLVPTGCSNGVCVVRAYIADTPGAARWPDQHGAFWGLEFRAVVPPERRRCGRPLLAAGCTLENREQLLTITAHTGGSVLLPCSCTELKTKPENFIWRKYKINTREWVEISNATDQYRNRVQLFNDHSPGNLSLLISHLTEEDGGDYECNVKGVNIYIRLTVKEPISTTPTSPPVANSNTSSTNSTTSSSPKPSDTDHSIDFFILVPVLLLLLGLGGVIYWRYKGRRRGQTESREQRMMKKDEQKTQCQHHWQTAAWKQYYMHTDRYNDCPQHHINIPKDCNGVVPDCHAVTQNSSGSSPVMSPALVLVVGVAQRITPLPAK
ncbi:hypothetical protein NFI96_027910, partial [Prochilodus magdalenae]